MLSPSLLKLAVLIRALQIALLIIVCLCGYIAWLLISNARMETKLVEQESLLNAQSAAVTRWKTEAELKQQAAKDALKEAEKFKALSEKRIAVIRESKASTCEEGIKLIDEALGL